MHRLISIFAGSVLLVACGVADGPEVSVNDAMVKQIEPATSAAGCSIAGNVIVQLHRFCPLAAQAQVEAKSGSADRVNVSELARRIEALESDVAELKAQLQASQQD